VHDDDVEICDEIISKYQSDLSKVQSLAAFPFHSPSLVSSVEMISINQFPAEHFVCNDSASMTLKWKLSLGVRQVTHRVRSQ
jgi:hypothetical protein